jgi:hypothetical protein
MRRGKGDIGFRPHKPAEEDYLFVEWRCTRARLINGPGEGIPAEGMGDVDGEDFL